jgi:putative membrane protein insertion efficiency factor
MFAKLPRRTLVAVLRIYQWVLSPLFGPACRYEPSCSHYAVEAVSRHGALRGSVLSARRLLRCHPLGDSGYDPVP